MPTESEIELPFASLNTRRVVKVLRYGRAGARPKAYLQTGLHADETPGMLVMHHLMNLLNEAEIHNEITGEIVLVPVANPIGLGQYFLGYLSGRFEIASGENFNRHYPDLSDRVAGIVKQRLTNNAQHNIDLIRSALVDCCADLQADSELEALRHVLLSLAIDSDICLDLHCDSEAILHLYLGTPLWPQAADLSAQLESLTTMKAEVSGGNPFDEAVSGVWWKLSALFPNHPIPPACLGATVEYRGELDIDDETATKDAHNLFMFLQRRRLISGTPGDLPKAKCDATPLEGVDRIVAPHPGVVVYKKNPGDFVAKDEPVLVIVDPLKQGDDARTELYAHCDGILYSRRNDRMARRGQLLCSIAGREPFAHKVGQPLLTS